MHLALWSVRTPNKARGLFSLLSVVMFLLCLAASSGHAQQQVTVRIQNGTAAQIDIFWRNYNGGLDAYGSVEPGRYADRSSYESHHWVVKQAGQTIAEYTVGGDPLQFFPVGDSSAAAATSAPQAPERVSVEFSNETGDAVDLFWIDDQGRRQPHGTIRKDQAFIQASEPGQRWVVTHKGESLLEYTVSKEQNQVVTVRLKPPFETNTIEVTNRTGLPVNVYNYADPKREEPVVSMPNGTRTSLKSIPGLVWVFAVGADIIESHVTQGLANDRVSLEFNDLPADLQEGVRQRRDAIDRLLAEAAGDQASPATQDTCGNDGTKPPWITRPALGTVHVADDNQFSYYVDQQAGRTQKYLMDDGNCAVHYELDTFQISPGNATIAKYTGVAGSLFDLQFSPEIRAWVDNGEMFVSLDLGKDFSLQVNGSRTQYNISRGGDKRSGPSFTYGPFLESLYLSFVTPQGFAMDAWFPRNEMTSSNVTRSKSKSVSSNLSLSPLLEMSQFGIGVSRSDDTSVSGTYDDYKIFHSRSSGDHAWTFQLCKAGQALSAGGASAPCPYQEPKNLIAEDWTDGLRAVDYVSGVYPVPDSSFVFEAGRGIAVYRTREPVNPVITFTIQLAVNVLKMKAEANSTFGAIGDRYDVSYDQRVVGINAFVTIDVSQLIPEMAR